MGKTTSERRDDEVTKSFINGATDNKQSKESSISTTMGFRKRVAEDKAFRKKLTIFISICYSFLILGLNVGLFGPTLLDLQIITGCSLEQASFFFNGTTIGYLTASIVVGIIFERLNKLLSMFIPSLLLSGVVLAIPWCSVYEVMVAIHVLKGFFMGLIDGVGNALLLHLLSVEVKTYMQILHFMFAFGGIISPLISAPFLSKQDLTNNVTHIKHTIHDNLTNSSGYFVWTTTQGLAMINNSEHPWYSNNSTLDLTSESEVYKAYIISAITTLTCAIPFIVLYCTSSDTTCPTLKHENGQGEREKIPIHFKISALVILCFIIAAYTAMEDTYAGFLATFTVKQFKWSKPQGAFATSVFWTSFSVGRFTGIFIINLFKQVKLLCAYSLMIMAAFVCLLVSSLFLIDEGIWVASTITGFGMSIFFPIFFSWTEENFFHVNGPVTSLIMACACIGVIVNPIILTRTIETLPIRFCYMLLVESGMLFILYLCAVYVARLIKQHRLQHHRNREIVIEVDTAEPLAQDTSL